MNFIICNKKLAAEVGIKQAILIGYLYIEPSSKKYQISNLLGITRKTLDIILLNLKDFEYPETFSSQPHWRLDVKELKDLGFSTCILYQHLKDISKLFKKEFFQQKKVLKKNLPLTERQIRSGLEILKEKELITINPGGKNNCNKYQIGKKETFKGIDRKKDKEFQEILRKLVTEIPSKSLQIN